MLSLLSKKKKKDARAACVRNMEKKKKKKGVGILQNRVPGGREKGNPRPLSGPVGEKEKVIRFPRSATRKKGRARLGKKNVAGHLQTKKSGEATAANIFFRGKKKKKVGRPSGKKKKPGLF